MANPSEQWAVVGGGILGMTLALRLRQQGHEVTLIEAADHFGGLADAWSIGGITWDRHYHVTLLSDTSLRGLLRELDLEHSLQWTPTRTGFYTDGQLYSMSNTWEFVRFPPLRLWDKLRLGATIFYASRIQDGQRLEKTLATDWLRRWSGERTFRRIWLPLLRAKLGENYRKASASFIWAIIARMYAARRTGLKKEMFGYVRGGYARVLERLTATLIDHQVNLLPGQQVTRVEPDGDQVYVKSATGTTQKFDRVALTVAAPLVSRMCPGLTAGEHARLNRIEYQGILCVSVLLKRPLAGFYVTNITDAGFPFTAVIEMSALVDQQALGGHGLVYLPRYVTQDDPAWGWSDRQLEDTFLDGFERMYPGRRQDVVAFRVSRVKHVLAIATLDYSMQAPPINTSLPGVHIVNSAQIVNGTLNVNETVQLAERAAQRFSSLPGRTPVADLVGTEA